MLINYNYSFHFLKELQDKVQNHITDITVLGHKHFH